MDFLGVALTPAGVLVELAAGVALGVVLGILAASLALIASVARHD